MFLSGKNPNELVNIMNEEVTKVIDWLNLNKLSLNLDKTHFIIFKKPLNKVQLTSYLVVNGVKINMERVTKFLGVMIDEYLTFKDHIIILKR